MYILTNQDEKHSGLHGPAVGRHWKTPRLGGNTAPTPTPTAVPKLERGTPGPVPYVVFLVMHALFYSGAGDACYARAVLEAQADSWGLFSTIRTKRIRGRVHSPTSFILSSTLRAGNHVGYETVSTIASRRMNS